MKLIASPPTAAEVETIRGLRAEGWNVRVIGQHLGIAETVVSRCLRAPEMFDDYVDEIAVDRCMAAEPGIWETLTYRERNAVLDRTLERRAAELSAPGRGWEPAPRRVEWLEALAELTGFPTGRRLLERAALNEKRREAQSA